jgi:uridine kinase
MDQRESLLRKIADTIQAMPFTGVLRVGVDGVDGAGKTMFADELAAVLRESPREIIRASTDSFHNPRAIRYRLGRQSPEGFYADSFNLAAIQEVLLDPLSPGGSRRYRTAMFDHVTDSEVVVAEQHATDSAILLFDGIFLHRPELRSYWDFSLFLNVPFHISIARCAGRDNGIPDPAAPENRRYVEGQKIYLGSCSPQSRATLVVDNADLSAPYIVE